MKLKSHLRTLMAALSLMAVSAGCNDKDDPQPATPTTDPTTDGLTFEITVSNITKTAADIDVVPSNNDDTYYFDVQMAAAFEGMSQEAILAEIIDGLTAGELSKGPDGLTADMFDLYAPLKAGTDYYVYAVGFDPDKGATSTLKMVKFTTEAATGTAPELTLSAVAGNASGSETATKIYCTAQASEAASGAYLCALASVVDDLIAQGATLDEIISANGETIPEEYLAYLTAESGLSITFSSLAPKTSYATIFKVTGAGGMSTVKRVDVTTTESTVSPSDMTFQVAVTSITSTAASVAITPSNNTDTYFFDVQPKSVIDSFEGNLSALISAFNTAYTQYGGVAGMLSTGEDGFNPSGLTAGTTYSVVAFGYSDGEATTALSTTEFTTQTAATSDMTFTIAVDNAATAIPGGVNATITPSNNTDSYLFAFTLADEIDTMSSDAEIVAYYEKLYSGYISYLTTTGAYATQATDFAGELACLPGAEYYIVAFGYDGGATTAVSKTKFTAGAGPAAAGTTFTFDVKNISDVAATVTVTASQEPVAYMWDVMPQADYTQLGGNAAGITTYIKSLFEYYIDKSFTSRQVIAGLGAWYSGAYYEYSSLDPSTVYVPFAACVDVNGNVIDTPVVGNTFTTLAATGTSAAGRFYGRYNLGVDLTPKIYRPLETNVVTSSMIETLRGRYARMASAAPKASVRGAGLAAPTAGVVQRAAFGQAAGSASREIVASASVRKSVALRTSRR